MKGLREGLGSGKKAEEASDEKEVAENLVESESVGKWGIDV